MIFKDNGVQKLSDRNAMIGLKTKDIHYTQAMTSQPSSHEYYMET